MKNTGSYGNVEGIQCDVSSYEKCEEAFSTVDRHEIYGIVNNAGINRDVMFKNHHMKSRSQNNE